MILIIINEKRVCILGVYNNPNMKSFPYMPYPNINMIDRCPEKSSFFFHESHIQTIYDFNLT